MLGYSTLPAVNGLSRSHNAPSVLQTDGFQTEGLASSPAKALISGLRRLVPSDEERFQSSGFDLNLSYITARIVSSLVKDSDFVGQDRPCEGLADRHVIRLLARIIALTEPIGDRRFFSLLPDIQRDSRQDVTRFLDTVYPGRYRIYDERGVPFPTSSYDARAAAAKRTYSLAVHGCIQSPPSLEEIDSFCKDATAWLRDPANVAVVQCEDGKSQNGVLICCLLLSQGLFKNPEKSLTHFQGKRLKPGRESDDMPPSLSRYVAYYFQLVRVPSTCLKISAPRPVNLREVRAFGLPSAHAAVAVWVRQRGDGFNEQRVYVLASPGCRSAQQFYACGSHTVTYEDKEGVLELQLVPCKATCLIHGNSLSLACRSSPLELDGDFKVQVFTGDFSRRKTHFCAWLNTAFVNTDHGVYLACDELDMPRRGAGAPGLDLFF